MVPTKMLKSFYNEKLCFPIGSANSETAPRLLYYVSEFQLLDDYTKP